MTSPERIYKWNKDANLLSFGYSDELESSMLIEEALEGFDLTIFCEDVGVGNDLELNSTPKEVSRVLTKLANTKYTGIKGGTETCSPLPDVDRFDKHLDAIFINYGSLFKLGLSVEQVARGLQKVIEKNMEKLSVGKDEFGKQMKPKDFVGPEKDLQKILDENK